MTIDKNVLSIVALVVIFIAFVLGIKTFKEKIVRDVIREFQREYSPGPYNPGFDPDKISPKTPSKWAEVSQVPYESPNDWNKIWEQDRN